MALRSYESQSDWRLAPLATRYPRLSTDRDTAEKDNLEWVTPGHPLFEALRRHCLAKAQQPFGRGACFYSLAHVLPARIDFYRARVVDGSGSVIHERLFAVELSEGQPLSLQSPGILGNFTPCPSPAQLPAVALQPEAADWLSANALNPFLEKVRGERLAEIDRVAAHVELSLTELIQKADEEVGRAAAEVEQKVSGAEGRLAQAEDRHQKLLNRRDRRRVELERQRALTLQNVERIASVLVLPHPEREAPEVRRLQPDLETEAVAMRVVIAHEHSLGHQVFDVHEKNLGYDVTSLDLASGELRLIEVKGIGGKTGAVLLTPNERRVAEDRPDCFWLYVVTDCKAQPLLQEPIRDPARFPWHEVKKVDHYWLDVNALKAPMEIREPPETY
jgi:hypothetical protein